MKRKKIALRENALVRPYWLLVRDQREKISTEIRFDATCHRRMLDEWNISTESAARNKILRARQAGRAIRSMRATKFAG